MRLRGSIALHVPGEQILRRPHFWDKVFKAFGGEPDLTTEKRRAALEAAAVVDAARDALTRIGATNAISLVIDDQVIFHDREGKADDLGDLFLAFADHAPVFGREFTTLRLAVEHEQAGLHFVMEIAAQTEHPASEPAARMQVSARIRALEPRTGEDAEAYRARVEPLTRDAANLDIHRHQFEAYVATLERALSTAMPEARVVLERARAEMVKPSKRPAEEKALAPTDRNYDPMVAYYPSPFNHMLSAMMWSSVFSMGMRPDIMVVDHAGHDLGDAADAGNGDFSEAGGTDAGGDMDAGGDLDSGGGFDDGGGFFDGGFDF